MVSQSPPGRRMTFTATPEIQQLLDRAKKELFYQSSRSQMIRALTEAGLRAWRQQNQAAPPPPEGEGL